MTKKWIFALPLAAALVVGVTSPLAAQVTTGTIVGTVSDASGVVPGATITVREVNKGTTNSYVTDGTGNYTASFLVPGTYAVEVNVHGFKKSIREGIILQVNQRARVDITLEVGRIEETTTVVSSAPRSRARPTSSSAGTRSICSTTRGLDFRTRTSTRLRPDGSRRPRSTTGPCSFR
jgi:hypothetical protein